MSRPGAAEVNFLSLFTADNLSREEVCRMEFKATFLWYVHNAESVCACVHAQRGCRVNVADAFVCVFYVYLEEFVNFAGGSSAVLCSKDLKSVCVSVVLKLLFALRGAHDFRRNLPKADFTSLWLDTFMSPVVLEKLKNIFRIPSSVCDFVETSMWLCHTHSKAGCVLS